MSRQAALRVGELVGGPLVVEQASNGWPALGTISTEEGILPVALFTSSIGLSHRNRDAIERRFQNPAASPSEQDMQGWHGKPIVIPTGRVPLLVGVWENDPLVTVHHPVLAMADALRRTGLPTRQSIFLRLDRLLAAVSTGYAVSVNADGERMPCFDPALLPALALAVAEGVSLPDREVEIAVRGTGLADARVEGSAVDAAAQRATRTATAYVRDARFRRWVVDAYGGRCALCGIGWPSLVQGAHVLPVGAPAARDEVTNGVCLCANHHAAFDAHLLWINPDDRSVRVHPSLVEAASNDDVLNAFVTSTAPTLADPFDPSKRVATAMLVARTTFYAERYKWL